jgi:nitroimidazol reductase NimA-like FMN-containing flavoprotein (pyridoxamine 5'-phosphate oxidase superfamily)
MFQEMRREDRKLSKNEAVQILMENQYGVLSTVCEDGYPYGVPLSYVYENETLYFHGTNEVSLKDNNIGISTKACFTVIGKTELLPAKFCNKI